MSMQDQIDEEKGDTTHTTSAVHQSGSDLILTIVASSAWQYIPTDVIYLIARHLDGRSLTRLGSCDRASHSVVQQRVALWRCLISNTGSTRWHADWITGSILSKIEIELEAKGFDRAKPRFNPRYYYVARYICTLKARRTAKAQAQKEIFQATEAARILEVRWIEEVAMTILIVMLFIIFVGTLISELQSSSGEVTYRSLWPLVTILSILFLSFSNLFYIRWRNTILCWQSCCCCDTSSAATDPIRGAFYTDTSRRLVSDQYWRTASSDVIRLILYIEGKCFRDYATQQIHVLLIHLSIFFVFLTFAVWILLITLKVTGTFSISWSHVWLPIYLSFGVFTIGVIFLGWFQTISIFQGNELRASIAPILLMLPLLLTAILMHLYLIGDISHLQYALMPLIIVHGILFLMAFGSICFGGTGYSKPLWTIPIPGWILLPAPLLLFQIFLTLKIDGEWTSISWVGVFAPLCIPLALLFIGVVILVKIRHSSLLSKARLASRKHHSLDMPDV